MTARQVQQGRQLQGEDEQVSYSLTTTPWGSSPTNVVVVVKDVTANFLDVTATVMPVNSPGVLGDVITLSILKSLTSPHLYRVEIKFTVGGNVEEAYFEVQAEM